MQGRLLPPSDPSRIQSFPRLNWDAEFELAAQAGLDCIEWIFDLWGYDVNPLGSNEGMTRLRELQRQSGVRVESVVADFFIERPLIHGDSSEHASRQRDLDRLIDTCAQLGIARIVLPFVDASSLRTPNEIDLLVEVLERPLRDTETNRVELHLETDLGPRDFASLLQRLDHPMVWVNYDSGNSASLGFDVREEFGAYGNRVGSVHLKDRLLGGTTVPPGTGHADFDALFESLDSVAYDGAFILQIARSKSGEELEWARKNVEFFASYLQR